MSIIEPRALMKWTLLGTAIIVALWVVAACVRLPDFRTTTGAENLEASYHVLLTVDALRAQPFSETKLLPIVTLGNPLDKNIPWGATVPDTRGNYFYTSFPPLGFLAPYAVAAVVRVKPSLLYLAIFNSCLGLISSLLLYAVLVRAMRQSGYGDLTAVASAVLGSAVIIFSREALHSLGLVYWAQSLNEVFLLVQLLVFLHVWSPKTCLAKTSWPLIALFGVASLITPSIEWTGYIANAVMAATLFSIGRTSPYRWHWVTVVVVATLAAAIVQCVHYFVAIGTHETIAALHSRFSARSATNQRANVVELMVGYWRSFGAFLISATVSAALFAFRKDLRESSMRNRQVLFVTLALTVGPMIENLLLMQHATQFSFDRLKFAVVIGLMVAFAAATLFESKKRLLMVMMVTLVAASSIQGYASYQRQMQYFSTWSTQDRDNRSLLGMASKLVDVRCAAIGTNSKVRGYFNVTLGRGVYENIDLSRLRDISRDRGNCGYLFIEQTSTYQDLPSFQKMTVRGPGALDETILTTHAPS